MTCGELPEAHRITEQVVAVCRRVLGDEHPDTLTSLNNLAKVLRWTWASSPKPTASPSRS